VKIFGKIDLINRTILCETCLPILCASYDGEERFVCIIELPPYRFVLSGYCLTGMVPLLAGLRLSIRFVRVDRSELAMMQQEQTLVDGNLQALQTPQQRAAQTRNDQLSQHVCNVVFSMAPYIQYHLLLQQERR